ncbi:MAG: low temperature requirement protein A [Acidimicrobiales bacterium]
MALTKWQPPTLRHEVDDEGRVTWLELFFDLVYVAALIQLGDRLSSDVSWSGGAAFIGAFVILWWTWTGTTAFTNRFPVDDLVHRVLAFAQMFAVGNIAVLAATNPDNWERWLALAYVGARLPLLAMYWRVGRSIPSSRAISEHFLRFFGLGAGLWLVSIAVPGRARLVVWAAALVVEFAAPVILLRRPEASPSDSGEVEVEVRYSEHLQERYALFTIIVLGETFVKTLSEVGALGISFTTQVFSGLAFLMLIALWWTYFDDVADSHIRATSAMAKSRSINRLLWVYAHLPLALGLTAYGVAAKKIVSIEEFNEPFDDGYTVLLAAALIATLAAVAVLDLLTVSPHFAIDAPERIGPRLVAAVLLVPVAGLLVTGTLDAISGIAMVTAIVVGQIMVEVVSAHRSEYRLGRDVHSQIAELAGRCSDLNDATAPTGRPARVCQPCAEKGIDWVQLRWCLSCGHVGCCDDSPGQHATAHHRATAHPVIASIEADATWAYCYRHEVTDPGWRSTAP